MLTGERYDPLDPELVADRLRTRLLVIIKNIPADVFAARNPWQVIRVSDPT